VNFLESGAAAWTQASRQAPFEPYQEYRSAQCICQQC
jgi:hypothetical protein